MAAEWFVGKGKKRHGPFSPEQLRQLARSGKLTPDDLVWTEGLPTWVAASRVERLFPDESDSQSQGTVTSPQSEAKSQAPFGNDWDAFLAANRKPSDSSALPTPLTVRQSKEDKNQEQSVMDVEEIDETSANAEVKSSATKACPFCAETILVAALKCKHCGERLSGISPAHAAGEENVFFKQSGILVTDARFVHGSDTYAVAQISSVQIREEPPTAHTLAAVLLFLCAFTVICFGIDSALRGN